MLSEFNFELSTPVKYDKSGEKIDGTFITLFAPSYKQMDKCVPLKQAFYRAMSDISDGGEEQSESTESTEELKPSSLIAIMYQSSVDMVKILIHGVELFNSPDIAKIDGDVKLTKPIIESMSQDDLELMLGSYMVNFILASALSKAESN